MSNLINRGVSNPTLAAGQVCHTRNNLAFTRGDHFYLRCEAGELAMVKVAKTSLRAAAVTAAFGILVVGIILA